MQLKNLKRNSQFFQNFLRNMMSVNTISSELKVLILFFLLINNNNNLKYLKIFAGGGQIINS